MYSDYLQDELYQDQITEFMQVVMEPLGKLSRILGTAPYPYLMVASG
jgi:hypothetical protein